MSEMDDSASQSSSTPATATKSKLRYPLRLAMKKADEKERIVRKDKQTPVSVKRERNLSTLTRSVTALHIPDKEKSSRPPRRLSIPTKTTTSQVPVSTGNTTPISKNEMKNSKIMSSSETPIPETSRMRERRRFSTLSSVSYWLSQIKLSEMASKHSISLGFFKLALESECEPLQRIREELKSYAVKHNIATELGEPARDLLQRYNILEDLESLQVFDQTPAEDGDQTSTADGKASLLAARTGTPKQRSLNLRTNKSSEASKCESVRKVIYSLNSRSSSKTSLSNSTVTNDSCGGTSMKSNKIKKLETNKGGARVEKLAKQSLSERGDVYSTSAGHIPEEDKENVDNEPVEETTSNGELQLASKLM